MNKKQKRALFEIIISGILLLFVTLLYPFIIKQTGNEIKGIFYYIQIAIYVVTYIVIGGRILLKSIKNISRGKIFDEFFLMSLATIVAFALQEFFEGVAVMLFYQIGELFQSIAVERSRKSITSLMEIAPTTANRVVNDDIEVIDVDEVNIGDILLIKVGDKIPVDGIVIEGNSTLDTSSLTGESLPLDVKENEEVLSGSINLSGVIKIKAKKVYEDSSVYKILTLIEEASDSKGKTEQFISKFAKYYTPTVVILALILSIIPPLFDSFQFTKWILRGMSFLVISCPCALVISIPLSFFSGIGKASKQGILIKGGVHLEDLNKTKTIFFDKTGTLTTGKFAITEEVNYKEDSDFKKLLKSMELNSTHPLAKAICEYYQDEEIINLTDIEEISGRGMKGKYHNQEILCGNDKLLKENDIEFESIKGTIIYLVKDRILLGYVKLEDQLKEDTKEAIRLLKKEGIEELIMITGDKEEPAKKIASEINLTKYYASLLPEEKLKIVKEYQSTSDSKVSYVGDGINDAPTLISVDVSFAMGKNGSSLAMESSDIVLMDDSLMKVYKAKRFARQTMRTCYLNIILALGIKVLCLVLGALGIGGMLLAIFADVGVMIICVINSMLNYYIK